MKNSVWDLMESLWVVVFWVTVLGAISLFMMSAPD
jgi:hypothetical protein